jgi:hypothetical protein
MRTRKRETEWKGEADMERETGSESFLPGGRDREMEVSGRQRMRKTEETSPGKNSRRQRANRANTGGGRSARSQVGESQA